MVRSGRKTVTVTIPGALKAEARRDASPDSSLLSILLSIGTGVIRHPEGAALADHDVRQRFTDFLPDFLTPSRCLISVRSEVQLLDGPSVVLALLRAFGLRDNRKWLN